MTGSLDPQLSDWVHTVEAVLSPFGGRSIRDEDAEGRAPEWQCKCAQGGGREDAIEAVHVRKVEIMTHRRIAKMELDEAERAVA